jgi:hypothetical protein
LTGLTGSREGLKEDYFCFGRTPKQKVFIHYSGETLPSGRIHSIKPYRLVIVFFAQQLATFCPAVRAGQN